MAKKIRTTEAKAIVNIDGERVPFIKLKIVQEMGEHDYFEVMVDYETVDESYHTSPEKILKKTNAKVVIDIWHADQPENTYVFSGKTTHIRMISEEGPHGGILFSGRGNTIELERGPMMSTYSNTSLPQILRKITDGTLNLDIDMSPEWEADIDFAIQHMESDWQFLQRICYQYRERFYYTGTQLVIGPHPEFKTTKLVYDQELTRFEVCSRLVPNQFSTYYYKREEDTVWEQNSPGTIENATNLLDIVSNTSGWLTLSRKPRIPTPAYVPDMGSLIEHNKRTKVSEGARMMYVKGICKTCDVRIGRVLHISMPPKLGGGDMGTYRVYNITHKLDQSGRYESEFEALPADLAYIPTPKVTIPVPGPLEVVVWDIDPDGSGRVRVEFEFDERPCQTWIPVMSFDAGTDANGSGNVSVNRGAVFLPEVGDRCVLNFLDGQNLAHPFIMGSLFHGKITGNQGGGTTNFIKTIITKSGHTIRFDDTNGKESIQIFDKKKNIIEIDTAEDTINISANSTITLTADNIHMMAKNTITATAGNTFAATSGVSSTITGGINTFINAGKDTCIKTGKTLSATSGLSTLIESGKHSQVTLDSKGNTAIKAKKRVEVSSEKQVDVVSKKQTTITGKDMKIQGKSKATVKGGKVHVG